MSIQPLAQSGSPKTGNRGTPALNKQSASKSDVVLRALRRKSGVSLDDLCKLTGWQAHSVRGFLSGTVRKKLGYEVIRQTDAKGVTRYLIGKPGVAS
jgi:hypothetical protein